MKCEEEDTVGRGCAFVVVLGVLILAALTVVGAVVGCKVQVHEEACVGVNSPGVVQLHESGTACETIEAHFE